MRNFHPASRRAWSAFVAGILGGLLYAWLHRFTRRPVLALWIITLGIATIDSLLIAALPFPAGPGPRIRVPIVGLIVPLRQLAALVGIGRFGEHHFPRASLPAVTVVHYVTAAAVSLIVPWWAGRGRGHPPNT